MLLAPKEGIAAPGMRYLDPQTNDSGTITEKFCFNNYN